MKTIRFNNYNEANAFKQGIDMANDPSLQVKHFTHDPCLLQIIDLDDSTDEDYDLMFEPEPTTPRGLDLDPPAYLRTPVEDVLASDPHAEFTVERGHGETYANNKLTLYAHSEYPPSSVLAGQPRRIWVYDWDDDDEARAELALLAAYYGPALDIQAPTGSTHRPVSEVVGGLPCDET